MKLYSRLGKSLIFDPSQWTNNPLMLWHKDVFTDKTNQIKLMWFQPTWKLEEHWNSARVLLARTFWRWGKTGYEFILWYFRPYGATRAKLVAPYFTPQWGDISRPLTGRIHPRPKAVAFCCRGKFFYEEKGSGTVTNLILSKCKPR